MSQLFPRKYGDLKQSGSLKGGARYQAGVGGGLGPRLMLAMTTTGRCHPYEVQLQSQVMAAASRSEGPRDWREQPTQSRRGDAVSLGFRGRRQGRGERNAQSLEQEHSDQQSHEQ